MPDEKVVNKNNPKNSVHPAVLRSAQQFIFVVPGTAPPVEAKRTSHYRGPVAPRVSTGTRPADVTGVAPEDGTGLGPEDRTGACPVKLRRSI